MEESLYPQLINQTINDPFKPWKDVFDHLVCGVVLIDASTRRISYANRVALTMTQWEEGEILGARCHDFICPAEADHCPFLDHARSIDLDERMILGKNGKNIPILKRVTRIEIEGRPYVLESFTDIQAQKERESELETLYGTDTLTGLPNRASLEKIIEDLKMDDPMHPQGHSLIMADLDLFKNVNDRFGHQAGDEVLREFGFVLKESMRKVDIVFRWGGEEFLIFARNTDSATASQIAERLRKLVEKTKFPIVGHITASFGIAQSRPGETFEKWFHRTDFCLSKAKHDGRNRIVDWEGFVSDSWHQGKIPWIKLLDSPDKELNHQHKELLHRINELLQTLIPLQEDPQRIARIEAFIAFYRDHTQYEERRFKEISYPYHEFHETEHQRIKHDLALMKTKLDSGLADYFSVVDYIVREIFVYHMSMEDTKFFPYLETKES